MQFANGFEIGKFHDLHSGREITRLPEDGVREWWIPLNDASAGALFPVGKMKNTLHGDLQGEWAQAMTSLIISRAPEKVILPYNGFGAVWCRDYITFLKAVWEKRTQINSSFGLYVPKKTTFCNNMATKLEKNNFRAIRMDKSSPAELHSFESYINYEQPQMPIFDLDAKEFGFADFYDFCCRKLAYIIKTEQLFPRLDSGMSNYNTGVFRAHAESDPETIIRFDYNCHTEYNFIHGQFLRFWKLLDEKYLSKSIPWLPLNPFCRDKHDGYCWWNNFPYEYRKIKKNQLSRAIFQCGSFDGEGQFLFPLVLFLGHYARYENAQCYIPEYNFHELIDALIRIIKGQEIPELLPDIPGEEEISLEAYRRGIVKLPPACIDYESKGDEIIAQFKNADSAYGFVEKIYPHLTGELCFADTCGKIVFRNVSDQALLLTALKEAKTICREYPIRMYLLDGTMIRKMNLREILTDAAERIVRHFPLDYRDAIHYLTQLSVKFKNQYKRYSIVK